MTSDLVKPTSGVHLFSRSFVHQTFLGSLGSRNMRETGGMMGLG